MDSVQNLFASSTNNAVETVTNLSVDTIILGIIFLVFFVYNMRSSRSKVISLIISLYIAIPIINFFPYMEKIPFIGNTENAVLYSQIGLFALIVILVNIITKILIGFEFYQGGLRKLIENGALAAATGGLLIAISYHIINISELYDFATTIDSLFASTTLFFWWLVIPLLVILFTTKR